MGSTTPLFRRSANIFPIRFLLFSICCSVLLLPTGESLCIKTKVGTSCEKDVDCYQFEERHLYCNKTHGANLCAFRIHSYSSLSEEKDCPGEEFSAEPWSNPISDDWISYSKGVDCMRLCHFTDTCFAVAVVENKCYLKNEKCLANLRTVPGALFGVLSVSREDYKCGCNHPFLRRTSRGEILSWESDCPESQLNRNPYRCCSDKGLCVKCDEMRRRGG